MDLESLARKNLGPGRGRWSDWGTTEVCYRRRIIRE